MEGVMERRTIEVDGLRMRWEEAGTGQPVVYVHGIPTCPSLWRRVVPLVPEARSLAWEMVGYGASIPEGRDRDISVARQAEHLARWMRALELGRAVLVGHDLGGGVAQILAVREPELVRGLVLTNAICYDSWPIPSVKAMRATGGVVERMPDAAFRVVFETFIRRGHGDRSRARESIRHHWPHYEAADGARAFVRQVRSLDVSDTLAVSDRLPDLRVPAALAWGAADRFQKIGYGYRLAHDLAASLDRIEGGKHFVPEDHPDRVAAAIRKVLQAAGAREEAAGARQG